MIRSFLSSVIPSFLYNAKSAMMNRVGVLSILCIVGGLLHAPPAGARPVTEDAQSLYEDGLGYQDLGELAQAIAYYTKALAQDPTFARVRPPAP